MTFASIVRVGLAAAIGAFAVCTAPVHAATPLEGRTVTGAKVDAYDPSAVMIYDPDQDLTWVRDWNLNDGAREWDYHYQFLAQLEIGEFSGWRFPETTVGSYCFDPYTANFNCQGELRNLWVNSLGNGIDQDRISTGPFLNMPGPDPEEYGGFYPVWSSQWASFPYREDERFYAVFETSRGYYSSIVYFDAAYVVAVRDGDVASVVPETGSLAMFLMGLGVVLVALRKRSS